MGVRIILYHLGLLESKLDFGDNQFVWRQCRESMARPLDFALQRLGANELLFGNSVHRFCT
jgi:hypothetical protein